jgi:hypothetical protein
VLDIHNLNLPVRIQQLLSEQGITTIEQLTTFCRRELSRLPKLGAKSLDQIEDALIERGLSLAQDPFAPYTCARHGQPRGDVSLESLYLCDGCAGTFQNIPFRGTTPEYVGPPVKGYCLHCNRLFNNVRLRQWYLCGICSRVVKSIGRSIVADDYLQAWWQREVQPDFPHLRLELTDPPELRSYDFNEAQEETQVDFICSDTRYREALFGIELKTGRGYVRGTYIGTKMGQFQLDHSDCDAILSVVHREGIPVYLAHAQVIDRVSPPTLYYVAVGLWWTELFSMKDNYDRSRIRPRENRPAAYYNINMFNDMDAFPNHLRDNGPENLKIRMKKEGIPDLYL